MKKKHFYSFVIALASMAFVACNSDDNEGKQPAGVPDKAKPSTEFTLSNIENEQYADDAVKMDVTTWGNGTAQEFKSLELFADGHFLITKPNAGNTPKRARIAARSTDINGTIEFDNGLYI